MSKKDLREGRRDIATSLDDVERRVWVHDNQYRIREEVSRCRDHDKLKAIEAILAADS